MSVLKDNGKTLKQGISIKKMRDKYIITAVPSMALEGISKDGQQSHDVKLYASISRARSRIMELAYCNDWQYFITITFDKEKVKSRYDIDSTMSCVREWIHGRNKEGDNIKYLLVPELHSDGAIHAHGLITGRIKTKAFKDYPRYEVPEKLRKTDYHNWITMSNRFGFCSLGEVKNHEAVSYYMTKYITKHLAECAAIKQQNAHIYYCSKGLSRAEKIGIFHKPNTDIFKAVNWDWVNFDTGQASAKLNSWQEVCDTLKDWEQIQ